MMYFALGILWLLNLYYAVTLLSENNDLGYINLVALVIMSFVLGRMVSEDTRR